MTITRQLALATSPTTVFELRALHASLPRSPSSRRAGRPWPRSNPPRITPPAERLTRRCASLPPVAAPNCSKAAAGAPTYPLHPCNKPSGRLRCELPRLQAVPTKSPSQGRELRTPSISRGTQLVHKQADAYLFRKSTTEAKDAFTSQLVPT